jgi:hypothetical protein
MSSTAVPQAFTCDSQVSQRSPVRIAKLLYRSACAIAVLAQLEGIPAEGVTVLSVRLGRCYTLQIHLRADQGYSVRTVHCAYPDAPEAFSRHITLMEALLDLDACESEYLACAEEERVGALDELRAQGSLGA